jgi:hypothetical protein
MVNVGATLRRRGRWAKETAPLFSYPCLWATLVYRFGDQNGAVGNSAFGIFRCLQVTDFDARLGIFP